MVGLSLSAGTLWTAEGQPPLEQDKHAKGFEHSVVCVRNFESVSQINGAFNARDWGGAVGSTSPKDEKQQVTWWLGVVDRQYLCVAMQTPLKAVSASKLSEEKAKADSNTIPDDQLEIQMCVGNCADTATASPKMYWGKFNTKGQGVPGKPGTDEPRERLPWEVGSRVTNGVWEAVIKVALFRMNISEGTVLTLKLVRTNTAEGIACAKWGTACWVGWGNVAAAELDPPARAIPLTKFAEAVAEKWRTQVKIATASGWLLGSLDPARSVTAPAPPLDALRLEQRPMIPVYAAIERRSGDLLKVNDYDFNLAPRDFHGTSIAAEKDPNATVTLFVDFGLNVPGTFEFEANPPAGVEIVIETGGAMHPTRSYRTTVQANGSNLVFRPAIAQARWTSLRFAWIRFRGARERGFYVRRLHGLYQHYPCPYLGDFACSDEILTRVWDLCAYSARTVMAQPVGNDPKPQPILQTLTLDRCDRHPWAGDSRSIQAVVGYVFGQYPLLKSAIERLVPTGQRPLQDPQGVAPYTLDWALGVVDYYRLSGDREYFLKRLPDLLAVLEKFDGPVPPSKGGYSMFFDWDKRVIPSTPENRAELEACFTGKYVQLGRELAWAAQQAGETQAAAQALTVADRHESEWRKANPDWAKKYGLHAVSNLILGGVLKSDEYAAAFARAYPERNRWTTSPFFTAYVLTALAKMGRHAETLDLARDYWGSMIAAGATTVWEEWDPEWRMPINAQPPQFPRHLAWAGLSLNQPVGTMPARWLLVEVVGIKPAAPGFRRVLVQPHPAGLVWARGSVATPAGPVAVQWRQVDKKLDLSGMMPVGVETAEFILPQQSRCVVNGRELSSTRSENGLAVYRFEDAGPQKD